ncbi:MAG: IS5 family transposase [Candidatus Sericytochromatia bacterium]
MKKSRYIITNWSEYNKSLKNRGRFNFWFTEDIEKYWYDATGESYYSDIAIEFCLTIMSIYHLKLRSVQGFLESIFKISKIYLEVPDYSTICRRRQKLNCNLGKVSSSDNIHVAVDSTGIKIYGECEWKVKMHDFSKRRTWRKLHIGVNESTGEILSTKVTSSSIVDSAMFEEVLSDIKSSIRCVSADKGYDKRKCYDILIEKGIKPIIDIVDNAVYWSINHPRNENLYFIKTYDKETWKQNSEYHRRSISENVFFRYKTIFGESLKSRKFESQTNDIIIRCKMLNKMFQNCKPISVKIC